MYSFSLVSMKKLKFKEINLLYIFVSEKLDLNTVNLPLDSKPQCSHIYIHTLYDICAYIFKCIFCDRVYQVAIVA